MAARGRSVPWSYIGLGVLTVIAAVLVVLALRPPEPPPPTITLDPTPAPTSLAPPVGTPDATAAPTEEAMGTPQVEPAPDLDPQRERPLSALSSRAALRATPGSCPDGGAEVEITDDQGRSWQPLPTPADQVLRVTRTAETSLWLVGASAAECTPGFSASEDAGESWQGPTDTTGAWHLLVDPDATRLHAPYSTVDSPCADRGSLEIEAVSFDEASVLCADGEVFTTINSGATWDSVGRTPAAVALGIAGTQRVVAVPSEGDCQGLAVGAPGAEAIGCVVGAPTRGVSMSFAGPSAGWVVAGDQTWTSDDAGTTWTKRS